MFLQSSWITIHKYEAWESGIKSKGDLGYHTQYITHLSEYDLKVTLLELWQAKVWRRPDNFRSLRGYQIVCHNPIEEQPPGIGLLQGALLGPVFPAPITAATGFFWFCLGVTAKQCCFSWLTVYFWFRCCIHLLKYSSFLTQCVLFCYIFSSH